MMKIIIQWIPFFIMASFLMTGCSKKTSFPTVATEPVASQAEKLYSPVYKGKVLEKSNKTKSISIVVGMGKEARTVIVKFDDKTTGVEHASKGHASIIFYEMRDGQPWATVVQPKLAKLPKGVTEIKTDELKALIDAKTDFTLVDARPEKRWAISHIPGAVSIGTRAYKKKAGELLPKDKSALVITYCGGSTCSMSTRIAGLLKKDGYKNINVYIGGHPAWIKAGNSVYTSKGNIEKGNIVLIDLRSKTKSEAGRIARSVSIPYDSLEDRIDDIPKKAPVVLYSDNTKDTTDAIKDLREEGYKKLALVSGNYGGWVKAGGKTVTGPVTTEINWVRKLEKGAIRKADFMEAVSGADAGAVILDVRTTDEASVGGFRGAILVPLGQIGSRLAEIPKNKKVYVHCTTGARADMAAQELIKNGYKAFFLVANVVCEGNDCEVED
jgi:rhodanese-related sulfurtransferase